eukprot:39158-Rhodomonas_salina.1
MGPGTANCCTLSLMPAERPTREQEEQGGGSGVQTSVRGERNWSAQEKGMSHVRLHFSRGALVLKAQAAVEASSQATAEHANRRRRTGCRHGLNKSVAQNRDTGDGNARVTWPFLTLTSGP